MSAANIGFRLQLQFARSSQAFLFFLRRLHSEDKNDRPSVTNAPTDSVSLVFPTRIKQKQQEQATATIKLITENRDQGSV